MDQGEYGRLRVWLRRRSPVGVGIKREFEDDDTMYTFELTYEDVRDMAEGKPVIKDGMFVGLYTFLYEQVEVWIYQNIETEHPSEED